MSAHFTPNNEIHFAVEGLKIVNNEDIEKVENIWSIKVLLPKCLKTL